SRPSPTDHMKNRTSLAAGVLLAALSVTACSGTPPAPASTPTSAPPTQTPRAAVTTTPLPETPQATAGEPLTCDTMVSEGTVDALTSQGWTFKEQPLTIGETVIEGGLRCDWADYT